MRFRQYKPYLDLGDTFIATNLTNFSDVSWIILFPAIKRTNSDKRAIPDMNLRPIIKLSKLSSF